jgi:hypothetical protein
MILKNPAPANIPFSEVQKKMMNFFEKSLNLKVLPPDNTFSVVKAVGEVNFKPSS